MIEPLTAVAWAFSTVKAIAQTEQGKKFIDSTIGKMAEKMTEAGLQKIGELRQSIVAKFKENPAAEEAFKKAEAFGTEDILYTSKNLTFLNDWNFQLIKLLSSLYLSIWAVSIKLEMAVLKLLKSA